MNQVKESFERIRVIRGVGNGVITNEQIQNVIIHHQLDSEQQQRLFGLLNCKGIHPIAEDELPRNAAVQRPVPSTVQRKTPMPEEQVACFDEQLQACLESFTKDSALVEQYREELPLLKKAIAEHGTRVDRELDWIVTCAVMDISNYRVRDIRDRGWVCGTHMYYSKKAFRRWLCSLFTESELTELIRCCSEENDLNTHQKEILLVLLHKTPSTIVHFR